MLAGLELVAVAEAGIVELISFTAGLGTGRWPADYEDSEVPPNGQGKRFDAALAVMDQAWRSYGVRPSVALGGLAPAAIARSAAPVSEGWVAPLFGFEVLRQGIAAARDAWARSGRAGFPRVITARYFSLGPPGGPDRGRVRRALLRP